MDFPTAPPTELGGGGLGAITLSGLAALGTFLLFLLLKNNKHGKRKIAQNLSWEGHFVVGYVTGNLYGLAGWNILATLVSALTHSVAVAWGAGIVALCITAWIWVWNHSKTGAALGGMVTSVLYNSAGGWWAYGSNAVLLFVRMIQAVSS